MDNFVSIYIICILLLISYIYYESYYSELVSVESTIDGRSYLVRGLPDKSDAANLLASVRKKLIQLVNHLEIKFTNDQRVARLLLRYKPNNLMESTPNNKYTSYSINKGEKVVLCLRSRNSKNILVKENLLMFVALHELSHIMTKSIGHTKEFWDNFRFLLSESIKIKIYNKQNFRKFPKEYCGTQITDSPL
jgi:predicted metal-dependent hydrolase